MAYDIRTKQRSEEIFRDRFESSAKTASYLLAVLLILQWIASMIIASFISPYTWNGSSSTIHAHVKVAFIYGFLINALPLYLAYREPESTLTRHVMTISQMLWSTILIHLCGGRIETHFHIFCSLALISFYRDYKTLITATIVVTIDHFTRGIFWPQSVYGVMSAPLWRSFEHSGWVLLQVSVLGIACHRMIQEMRAASLHMAELEMTHSEVQNAIQRETHVRMNLLDTMRENTQIRRALEYHGAVMFADSEGKITSANDTFFELTKYSKEELIGKSYLSLSSQSQEIILFKEINSNVQSGTHWNGDIECIAKDGTYFWLNMSVFHYSDNTTNEPGYLTISSNITDLKDNERNLNRRTQELEESEKALTEALQTLKRANLAKSRFIALMSHEIRTPLNGIKGALQLIEYSQEASKKQQYLSIAIHSCDSLSQIVNDILDFTKIEANKLEFLYEPFQLRDLLDRLIQTHYITAKEKDVDVLSYVDPRIPEKVVSDEMRVSQILNNFLSNAVKFTENGHIKLKVEKIDHVDNYVYIKFIVADTGIGFEPELTKKLFSPFEQADVSTTKRFGGTGLGLPISKQLTELMGGSIGAESEMNTGATFWVILPFEVEDISSSFIFDREQFSDIKLLILGESPSSSQSIIEQISAFGFPLHSCCSLEELTTLTTSNKNLLSEFNAILVIRDVTPEIIEMVSFLKSQYKDSPFPKLGALIDENHEGVSRQLTNITDKEVMIADYPVRQSDVFETLMSLLNLSDGYSTSAKTIQSKTKELATFQGLHALVAEDFEMNQLIISEILNQLKITFTLVSDGNEAIRAFKERRPDFVVMDYHMPNMDGIEASKRIQEYQETQSYKPVPVIAMTADVAADTRKDFSEIGVHHFLPKPIDLDKFTAILHTIQEQLENHMSDKNDIATPHEDTQTADEQPFFCLDELRTRFNERDELINLVLKHFKEQITTDIQELKQALGSNNFEGMYRLAHGLKGAAATIGATQITEIATALEEASKTEDITAIASLLERLTLMVSQCLDYLNSIQIEGGDDT